MQPGVYAACSYADDAPSSDCVDGHLRASYRVQGGHARLQSLAAQFVWKTETEIAQGHSLILHGHLLRLPDAPAAWVKQKADTWRGIGSVLCIWWLTFENDDPIIYSPYAVRRRGIPMPAVRNGMGMPFLRMVSYLLVGRLHNRVKNTLGIIGENLWEQRKCMGRFGEHVPEIGQMFRRVLPFRFIKKFYGRLE